MKTEAPACKCSTFFAAVEELGLVLEVDKSKAAEVVNLYTHAGVPCSIIGQTTKNADVSISVAGVPAISGTVGELRDVWEETSFQLERLQVRVGDVLCQS